MMRVSRCAFRFLGVSLLCWGGLGLQVTRAGTAPCEEELREVLEGLARDLAAKEVEAVLSRYSDTYMGSYSPYTKEQVREVCERLGRTSQWMKLSWEYKEFHCAGDLALVIVTETFERQPLDQPQPETNVRELQIHFEKQDGQWRMLWDYELAADQSAPQAGQEYRLPHQGFALTLPEGYRYRPAKAMGAATALVGISDDLKQIISIRGNDIGIMIRPEQLGDLVENQVQLFFPDCVITGRQLSEVQGLPQVLIDVECPQFQGVLWGRTALVLDRKDILVVATDSLDGKSRAEARARLNQALAGLHRIPKTSPATFDLAKGRYYNKKYGLEVVLPQGWETTEVAKGKWVTAKAPCGSGTIAVGVVDLMEDVGAMSLVEKEDETTKKIVAGYCCEKRGPIEVGGLAGAQSLSRFELGDGIKRWRVCFTRGQRAYVILCDAQPVERFEKLEPEFRRTVESLRVKTPGQDRGAGQSGGQK